MTAFKKNEKVTYISSYDGKGTFSFVQAIVYSCGKKQMILVNEATGEEMGRHFQPVEGTLPLRHGMPGTFKRLSDEEAEAKALEIAAQFIEQEKARIVAAMERNANQISYCRAMQEEFDAIHAPAAIKR